MATIPSVMTIMLTNIVVNFGYLATNEISHIYFVHCCACYNHSCHFRLLQEDEMSFYSSTLYVGLACAVPPTNTNFQLTFLLTRLQEALYEDLPVSVMGQALSHVLQTQLQALRQVLKHKHKH